MTTDLDNGPPEERRSILERHVQTIIVSATIALLGWQLLTTLDIREKLTRFEERLLSLQGQVNSGIDDRFRGADWRREERALNDRFDRVEKRLDKVEAHKLHQ